MQAVRRRSDAKIVNFFTRAEKEKARENETFSLAFSGAEERI